MASSIKLMASGKQGARVRGLTCDTANAFHRTLHAIVYLIKDLLDQGYDYVLPGKIQSDCLEEVFSIYRGSSGGNYFISCDQVISSLSMQRLKLYNTLEIQQSNDLDNPCCLQNLESNDDDIELVDSCSMEKNAQRYTIYLDMLPTKKV